MVTSFRPLRAYVYREGLTRFASRPYSTEEEHLSDVYRHLTNYSINKAAENFQENQRVQADNYGHKWSISALNRHLRCVGVNVKETLDSKALKGLEDHVLLYSQDVEPYHGHHREDSLSRRATWRRESIPECSGLLSALRPRRHVFMSRVVTWRAEISLESSLISINISFRSFGMS